MLIFLWCFNEIFQLLERMLNIFLHFWNEAKTKFYWFTRRWFEILWFRFGFNVPKFSAPFNRTGIVELARKACYNVSSKLSMKPFRSISTLHFDARCLNKTIRFSAQYVGVIKRTLCNCTILTYPIWIFSIN